MHRCAPRIVAADAHLRCKQTQEHVTWGWQLLLMGRLFQHQRAVGQQACREVFVAGLAHTHAVAMAVGHLNPAQPLMIAGFLRHQIWCVVCFGSAFEHAELGAVQAVTIGFGRSQTVEAQVRILDRQHPFHAERR